MRSAKKDLLLWVAASCVMVSSVANAQSPQSDWFPWAYSVGINDPIVNQPITADHGFDRLKKTELWSSEGERLLLQLFASEVFEEALSKYAKFATGKPQDASTQARCGMLLTHAAYSSEEEEAIASLSAKADKLFDRAIQIDEYNWEAWLGKAALYGYAEVDSYEKAAIQILTPLLQSQEQDPKMQKYAYTYLLLGDMHLRQEQPDKAKTIWQQGADLFPTHQGLQVKVARASK